MVDANATSMGIGEIYLHHRDETLLTRTRNFGRTILRISPFPPLTQSRATDYVITIKKKANDQSRAFCAEDVMCI